MEDESLQQEGTVSIPASAAVDPVALSEITPKEEIDGLFGQAIEESWVISGSDDVERLFRDIEDTGYRMSDEEFNALPNSFDNDQLEALRGATSEEELELLKEEFNEANERRQALSEQGDAAIAAQIGATLIDPVLWGATIGAEMGGAVVLAARASRLARLTRALGSAGVAEAGIVAVRNQVENDYSARDMTYDFLTALVMTGAVEATLGTALSKLSKEAEDATVNQTVTENTGTLDAGAAERDIPKERLRIDEYARAINSDNPEVQTWAQQHMQDPVSGGSDSTAVNAQRLRDNWHARANTAFENLWKSHKEAGGGSSWNAVENARQRQELSQKVWEARVLGTDHGPEVAKVANEWGSIYDEILEEAKVSELAGFKDVESNPNYMRQSWDGKAWSSIEKELGANGQKDLTALIEKGLYGFDEIDINKTIDELLEEVNNLPSGQVGKQRRKLQDEIDELVAIRNARTELAIGFTNRMLSRADGDFRSIDELLEDEALLKDWLKENPNHKFTSDAELEKTIRKALSRGARKNKDVVDRAKRRIQIDPKASITASNGRQISVHELMNKDALRLNEGYINSMSGHVAFAKNGVKRPSDWADTKNSIFASEVRRLGGGDDARKQAQKLVDRMDRNRAEIYGQPRFDTSSHTGHRLVNLMLKWNFMTAMGKAAFSAGSEMGRIVAENGIRNTLKTITAFDGLFSDSFRTINKNRNVVTEANAFNASIGDEHLVRLFNSFDETGIMEGSATAGFLNKAEIVAHRGAQVMAKASLLAPVDKGMRLLSFSSSVNSMYNHLIKGKPTRMALNQMGLTRNVLDNIARNMRAYTSVSSLGHVNKLGIEKWDKATADAFMNAMTVNGARQVQKALAGESAEFTSHPFFRVFTQFRQFTINAYSKHLRADMRDFANNPTRIMLATTYASMFSLMAYYARTMASATGMEESKRKEFLEDRLSTERVAANAINYTPNLGIGVTLNNMTFGHLDDILEVPVSRTTGLTNTSIGMNPTTDKVNRILSALRNIRETDTSNPVKDVRPFIPLQNTIPGDLILNPLEAATQ